MIVYVQKKAGFDFVAQHLCAQLREVLNLPHLERVVVINAYLVDNMTPEDLERVRTIVFSEPQVDDLLEDLELGDCNASFAIQTLKGQFCPRSHAAMTCLQMLNPSTPTPLIEHATIYKLYGKLQPEELKRVRAYLTNPLENHEVALPLQRAYTLTPSPPAQEIFDLNAISNKEDFLAKHHLALSCEDLDLIAKHLPSVNFLELKILDTFWSDHCRHTTFHTELEISTQNPLAQEILVQYMKMREELKHTKPISLMDLSTIMARSLKAKDRARAWVVGAENNACTLDITINTPQGSKPYYLFFKNETHNHPTEIEPYGGASTCIGGAIRDPLSARGVVYAGIRISGCANPLEPIAQTRAGKLPQRKIALGASEGFSAYGNQIGVATGLVHEVYHPGYKAKHLELGAVVGCAPQDHVRSLEPKSGDMVVLVGGRTGRDGLGGASGSSQAHHTQSLELCGAQVQKGDALQERKLQRLMRNPKFCQLIKRCNDFGAGGVSVAIPELAPSGVRINLDAMPTKYENLSPFDLALSESQERMAMLIEAKDLEAFQAYCESEGVLSAPIAQITTSQALEMYFQEELVARIPMALLHSHGASRFARAQIPTFPKPPKRAYNFLKDFKHLATDLNQSTPRGLIEQFDSTIGGNSIFMPLGGIYQATPIQVMAHKIPFEDTSTCSLVAFGFDPYTCDQDPIKGGYLAVIESVCKLVACGAQYHDIYLSFQEYFESLGADAHKWGKPVGVLLGALLAQQRLNIACIGGKDSMSGSFEDLSVPPTFVSFAFCAQESTHLISPEFKAPGHFIYLLQAPLDTHDLPTQLDTLFESLHVHITQKRVISAYALGAKGVAQALIHMSLGNRIGVELEENLHLDTLFAPGYGGFVLESVQELEQGLKLGHTSAQEHIRLGKDTISIGDLQREPLDSLYPTRASASAPCTLPQTMRPLNPPPARVKIAKPRVLIPIFPGTNCEYDTQRAFERAGAMVQMLVINDLTPQHSAQAIAQMQKALQNTQILFLSGGFSGADEPDGAAKLIKAFFSNMKLQEVLNAFLENRDGLIGGICNGFQALLKLGLLPFGRITPSKPHHPTLLPNAILRHQSKIVHVRVISNASPWLSATQRGAIYAVPISHGEGRFFAPQQTLIELAQRDQIATQYVNLEGQVSLDTAFNPNGSLCGIEGITSPCGRIFGKMGHSERVGAQLYKNVKGDFSMPIFEGAVKYFSQ
ncbi:phosphoribosylformylglycinamidine synthase [Helicobacter salomonis]|uniref:phosphoribosylformylglycinamidine synthase n=1 Tax=Helicobacter salomonis TaxID=56878 RepID=UPI000CF144C6|nr:phosphoribosylformylglycinamidine synthase [Helicobacter salomonis]